MKKTGNNIIFDIDGTLLDSMSMWENLGSIYLKSKSITPPNNLTEIIENKTLEESAEYFIRDFGLNETVENVVNGILSLIKYHYEEEVVLKPHTLDLLEKEKASGSRMCILTATDKDLAIAALKRNGILDYFEEVYTCSLLGLSKRHPEIFIKTCELMNFEPENTVVYEDALYAIKSAKKAGLKVIAVNDSSNRKDIDEIKSLADKIIS